MYKKITLDNGLRIVACPMPKRQSISLGIWIKVGGRYEGPELKGCAHFLEHLLFKGSKKFSCRKIKETIEGVGGSLNGFTSEELTCYLAKMPAAYSGLAAEILSDMVLNPLILKEDVRKEKPVILEEIKMYKDLPQSYVYELLDELLWPGHPLGMNITGTAESVGRLGREELRMFSRKYYTASNIVVSAAGALDFDRFVRKIGGIFSREKKKDTGTFVKAKTSQSCPQLKIFSKDTEQTHLALGFHGFERGHHLRHAATLLHIILGANMSSRLFNEVREKRGLAYEIGTQVKRLQDTGAFLVHAGIDNRKVIQAVTLILKELAGIRRGLVGQDEFKRAKEFYFGQLMLALEDTMEQMLWIGESTASLGQIYAIEDIIKEVKSVSREDLRDAAGILFQEEKINLALIGPLKGRERGLERILSIK